MSLLHLTSPVKKLLPSGVPQIFRLKVTQSFTEGSRALTLYHAKETIIYARGCLLM